MRTLEAYQSIPIGNFSSINETGGVRAAFDPKTTIELVRPQDAERQQKALPFNMEEFVPGSKIVALGRNEWFVSVGDASLPSERSYGVGNPMPMRAEHAPGAGRRAQAIMEAGRAKEEILPVGEEVKSIKKALEHTRAFIELKAGNNPDTVACVSQGLTWDRQSPIEDVGRQMARSVVGEDAQIVWFGPHKFIAIGRKQDAPELLLDKFVEAPRKPYEEHLAHLSTAQNRIQNRRLGTLAPWSPKGKQFIADYNGGESELVQAFQADGGWGEFGWNYKKQNGEWVGIDADGKPQKMMDLVHNNHYEEDADMKNKITAENQLMSSEEFQELVVFTFNFDISAVCCGFSSNAQQEMPQEKTVFSNPQIPYESKVALGKPGWDDDKDERLCDGCGQKNHAGKCPAMEEQASSE